MVDDTLAKIKALKAELRKLEAQYAGKAGGAAGVRLALEGLADAAKELEATNPKLAAAVAEICRELSTLGI